ncbi:unnamed protein product [Phyllotreta striolata]|uniref:Peptidase S1 domain-containing protein n=1 Tax=Phyllotreta striolata TaxID=444603 RepID=A0A9P0GXJ0_PHYSR|nr:unnamed protein product [Phyllotreta striolata]
MIVAIFVLLTCAFTLTRTDIASPCPKYFVFEPNKSQEDRWYGLITLESKYTINGVTIDLQFDKSIIQLGNYFGPLTSDSDNINFKISNPKKDITPSKPLKVEIYAVYDPYVDIEPPKLVRIKLNGREICPNYHQEEEETIISVVNHGGPTIINQINLPKCGTPTVIPTGLIVRGEETTRGQYPWHAALYRKEGNSRKYICGGTLINDQYVLTAAHCTTAGVIAVNPNDLVVVLGKHALWVDEDGEQTFYPTNVYVHENFTRTTYHHDISLIKLNQPTKYTEYVRPICLWSQSIEITPIVQTPGTAVGWGKDHLGNKMTDLLMSAGMEVVDRLDCILSRPQYYSLLVNKDNFCAGFRNGTSVCNGDSGGGLIFPRAGTRGLDTIWEIRGIVSNSVGTLDRSCDPKHYVIFTDVAQYLDWIKQKTS